MLLKKNLQIFYFAKIRCVTVDSRSVIIGWMSKSITNKNTAMESLLASKSLEKGLENSWLRILYCSKATTDPQARVWVINLPLYRSPRSGPWTAQVPPRACGRRLLQSQQGNLEPCLL